MLLFRVFDILLSMIKGKYVFAVCVRCVHVNELKHWYFFTVFVVVMLPVMLNTCLYYTIGWSVWRQASQTQVFSSFPQTRTHTHTHTCIYIYIYIYICVLKGCARAANPIQWYCMILREDAAIQFPNNHRVFIGCKSHGQCDTDLFQHWQDTEGHVEVSRGVISLLLVAGSSKDARLMPAFNVVTVLKCVAVDRC